MTEHERRKERLQSAAEQLGVPLEDATAERLLQYVSLMARWNGTYNLTSVRDPDQMLVQHVVDSLAAVVAASRRFGLGALRVLDVGSGGGLPGVVWAIVRPQDHVVCVDAVNKKAAFVRQVAVELGIPNLQGEHARVEALRVLPFDLVTSRAFAALGDFVRWTRSHVAKGGCWMAMKGKTPHDEMAALPAGVEVFHVEQLHVPELGADRCLVWMRPTLGEG